MATKILFFLCFENHKLYCIEKGFRKFLISGGRLGNDILADDILGKFRVNLH